MVGLPSTLALTRDGARTAVVGDARRDRFWVIVYEGVRTVKDFTLVTKDELANTAIQITCYDRNGNEVKRVTSSDPGTVEDNEEEQNEQNGTGSENGSGSEQGSGNGSSTGSETASVEAPVISGETPFDESTEVTISGPDGAEIRYTTDGTAPKA